ncbi:MAG TPA: hypothetical protein VGL35_05770 [Rhizomicrobium sp.]
MGKRNWGCAISGVISLLMLMGSAQGAPAPYPGMAPRDQYLIADRSEESALARSAAPPSISDNAEVMILGAHGFETASKGTNGFVCLVERSWDKPFDDPEFWNPKMRAPVCMNAAAVRTVLPVFLERAQWALSGLSLAGMRERSRLSEKANITPATGAMSFMMSKRQYLSDTDRRWYPHVMFFSPRTDPGAWGANLKASPVLGAANSPHVTFFFIPVRKWSDGTLADYGAPADSSEHHLH